MTVAPHGRRAALARPWWGAAGGQPGAWLLWVLLAGLSGPASGQITGPDDPLLPDSVSEETVRMRGRYCHQWREADGTLVLMYTGGFSLDFGRRSLRATDSVVWIAKETRPGDARGHFRLTVYLSDTAQVQETAGTVIEDRVLLVSNIRTFGEVSKEHDAYSPESAENSNFYRVARHQRERIEAGLVAREGAPSFEVAGLTDAEMAAQQLRRRIIRFQFEEIEPAKTSGGESIFVSRGRMFLFQSGDTASTSVSIQADNAVIFPAEDAAATFFEAAGGVPGEAASPLDPSAPAGVDQPRPEGERGAMGLVGPGQIAERIRAVYLEGDVQLTAGERFIRASRLYYDFEQQRALILDGVMRAELPDREIPLYLRASEIRQISAREFRAENARVSTSEFFTPSYHVGAERVYLRDNTQRDGQGEAAGLLSGQYELRNTTLNVDGVPIAWWPYSQGTLESSETLIRRLRTGFSDDYGFEVETAWHLFNLLGISPVPGFDPTLRLDYFSKRGPAIGIDADYLRDDHFGVFRSYYVHDQGEDNLGPLFENTPSTQNRGRVLWRHRHYLPNDWELTLELSYLSDPGFLQEWRKSEFNEGKEQETLVYLKRAKDTEAVTLLANWRVLDFVTQTEHLPDATYRRIGDVLFDSIVSYTEGRVGTVRYRPDDRRFFDDGRRDNTNPTDVTFRTDVRQELELPLKLGPLNLVPFSSVRGTYWDGNPHREGTKWRGMGVYGARGGTTLSRVFDDVQSELLDIHRIRHIIRPEFAVWWANSNTRSELLTPYDFEVEEIDAVYGGMIALRQTWQTKRGAGDRQRTVDLATLNVEAAVFGGDLDRRDLTAGYANPLRPEASRTRNYIAMDASYRISDTTSLLYDFNIDLNDGKFDRQNVALAIERSPRLAYVFGWRSAGDVNMDLFGGGFNYRLNEKHIIATRAYWDADRGELGELAIGYVRKLQRWYLALNFEVDNVFKDVKVSVSLWPEGIPEWTLGSRRFTGLGTSTGIRP